MSAGIFTALSGVQAGGNLLHVRAHNIANAQTEGFKRLRAIPMESSAGGVVVHVEKDDSPGPPMYPNGELQQGSHVDLNEEILSHLQAAVLLEANLVSVHTQDQVLGSLLNIME